MALRDLLSDYMTGVDSAFDPQGAAESSPDFEVGPRISYGGGDAEAKQAALATLQPDTEHWWDRLGKGVVGGYQRLGGGFSALIGGVGAAGIRALEDPYGTGSAVADAASSAIHDPQAAVAKVANVAEGVATSYVGRFVPREGETGFDVLKRNVLDYPVETLMDASMLGSGAGGLGEALGIPGAAQLSAASHAMDPISIASGALNTVGKPILETLVPGATAQRFASRFIADTTAQDTAMQTAIQQRFDSRLQNEVFQGLGDTEKTLFFPYTEGRLKAMSPESGMAGGAVELGPNGNWQPRAIDPDRLASLEQARQAYLPILDEFELSSGFHPDQAALRGALAEHRAVLNEGLDPSAPENVDRIQQAGESTRQEALAAQQARATVSTRTALNVRQLQDFQDHIAQLKLDETTDHAGQIARSYPPPPASVDDALAEMDLKGGDFTPVYFPHSAEFLTKDQATVGNIAQKVGEALPWKTNEGAMFRAGVLDHLDPASALMRTFMKLNGGIGVPEVAEALGQKMGEALPASSVDHLDPQISTLGTHQILDPAAYHQAGAVQEHFNDLAASLIRQARTDPATASLNMADLASQAAEALPKSLPLAGDRTVYKVPRGVVDALNNYKKSLEPTTNPFVKALDNSMDAYHFFTLGLSPKRLLNIAVGHSVFQAMEGIHPFSTSGIGAITDTLGAVASKLGLPVGERSAKIADVFDLPGVSQNDITSLARTGATQRFLSAHGGPPGQALAWASGRMNNFVRQIQTTQRALSAVFELRNTSAEKWGETLGDAAHTMDLGDRIRSLAHMGPDALTAPAWKDGLDRVNRFLGNYNRSTPMERTLWRRIFPYEKFYRHATELITRYPFENPAQATMLRGLGQAAVQDRDERLKAYGFDPHTMVPPSMRNSVPVDVTDDPVRGKQVRMLNAKGLNPFALVTGVDPGDESLAAMNPYLRSVLETMTGVNLGSGDRFEGPTTSFTGKEVDPATGTLTHATVRPGPVNLFARAFWPDQVLRELVARGRVPFDSSSIADMVMASANGHEGEAFQTNARGIAERRPGTSPLMRPFIAPPQTLEAPTRAQSQSNASAVSDIYNKFARTYPQLSERLRGEYVRQHERLSGEREQGGRAPYRSDRGF